VEADYDEESTRLNARSVQVQLASQALSIANSQPGIILSLFNA
jgi:flagellin